MVRLVESPAAAIRLAAAQEFVTGFAPDRELLLIGATREAVDDFVRGLTVRADATFGLHRFTLVQLAARIAAEHLAAIGSAPATALATEALATRCVYEAISGKGLSYFAPVSTFPGFARALARTARELRLARVDRDAVHDLGEAGADLSDLLARFDAALTASRTVDRAELLRLAAHLVRAGDCTLRVNLPTLLLDVEVASPMEGDLIRALTEKSPDVLVTVPAGDQRTLSLVRNLVSSSVIPAQVGIHPATVDVVRMDPRVRGDDREGLARLRHYLFSDQAPEPGELDESVRFFSAPGEGREAIEIARYVLDEARAGVPFDEIAIFLRTRFC